MTAFLSLSAPLDASVYCRGCLHESAVKWSCKVPSSSRARLAVRIEVAALLHQKNGDAQRVGFDALAVGQTVQVWFTGPLKESYPVQVDAKQIVILG